MLYRVENALVEALPKKKLGALVSYAGATLFVGVSFFIRWRFKDYWNGYPFLLFIPAIFLSALLLDRASGLYATALSAGLAAYFFIEPVGSLAVSTPNLAPFIAFVAIGAGLAFMTELLRHALNRISGGERRTTLLMRELAHRTKNDFMVLASIVKLQAREHPEAMRAAFDALADRIAVMAKVHEQLQPGDEHVIVDAREYLEGLCEGVSGTGKETRPISVQVTADPVQLMLGDAVPVGLIVNELVTNALKYAFPEGQGGTVDVGFKMADQGTAEIVVRDNGVGCPPTARDGLGSQLVRTLARQMKGTVKREGADRGCRAVVRVQLRPA